MQLELRSISTALLTRSNNTIHDFLILYIHTHIEHISVFKKLSEFKQPCICYSCVYSNYPIFPSPPPVIPLAFSVLMVQFPLGHHLTSIVSLKKKQKKQIAKWSVTPKPKMWCQCVKLDKYSGFVCVYKREKEKWWMHSWSWSLCITKCLSGKIVALKTPVFGAEFLMRTSVQKHVQKNRCFWPKQVHHVLYSAVYSAGYLGRGQRPLNLSSST